MLGAIGAAGGTSGSVGVEYTSWVESWIMLRVSVDGSGGCGMGLAVATWLEIWTVEMARRSRQARWRRVSRHMTVRMKRGELRGAAGILRLLEMW